MGLYISIPLPGPFRYSKRIEGKRRRSKRSESITGRDALRALVVWGGIAAAVVTIIYGFWWVAVLTLIALLTAGRIYKARKATE